MSSRRQFRREKDIREYEQEVKIRSPAQSMPSNSNEIRPMDEISLLKKGLIKDGQHRLRSGKPFHENVAPISLQELTTRGLTLDSGKIIYSLPGQGLVLERPFTSASHASTQYTESSVAKSTAKTRSLQSRLNSVMSQSIIEPAINTATFRVGLPHEEAVLHMGDTAHGQRYELIMGNDFHLVLMDTGKTSSITVCKDV